MTLSAHRPNPTSPNVKVTLNYGPIFASCEENHQHVRSFHTLLGQLLDEMEKES